MSKTLMQSTPEDWRSVFEFDVICTVVPTKACADVMVKYRYGRIINLSSITARTSVPQWCAYGATKAAVSNMTQSFVVEFGPPKPRVVGSIPASRTIGFLGSLVKTQQAKVSQGPQMNVSLFARSKQTAPGFRVCKRRSRQ